MQYFAYGSNMNLKHLRAFLHRFGVEAEGVNDPRQAVLHDFRLRTNYYSSTHAAGACNIEPAEGAVVEGLVMTITPAALEAIKIKEGWPGRYVDLEIDVHVDGEQVPISSITFVVHSDHCLEHDHPVTRKYRDLVLAGAEEAGLSQEYQGYLRSIVKTHVNPAWSGPCGSTSGRQTSVDLASVPGTDAGLG